MDAPVPGKRGVDAVGPRCAPFSPPPPRPTRPRIIQPPSSIRSFCVGPRPDHSLQSTTLSLRSMHYPEGVFRTRVIARPAKSRYKTEHMTQARRPKWPTHRPYLPIASFTRRRVGPLPYRADTITGVRQRSHSQARTLFPALPAIASMRNVIVQHPLTAANTYHTQSSDLNETEMNAIDVAEARRWRDAAAASATFWHLVPQIRAANLNALAGQGDGR
ncbi:hypothetical protein FKP32DRAFT_1597187 [Trametes sanguinea]|nr:hypothetical protein FKP32DRAFT_1597187 [Trametes sanguinea]